MLGDWIYYATRTIRKRSIGTHGTDVPVRASTVLARLQKTLRLTVGIFAGVIRTGLSNVESYRQPVHFRFMLGLISFNSPDGNPEIAKKGLVNQLRRGTLSERESNGIAETSSAVAQLRKEAEKRLTIFMDVSPGAINALPSRNRWFTFAWIESSMFKQGKRNGVRHGVVSGNRRMKVIAGIVVRQQSIRFF